MRTGLLIAAVVAVLGAVPNPAFAASYTSPDGTILVNATEIEFAPAKIVARGKAHVRAVDRAAGTDVQADADKIVVTRFADADTNPAHRGMNGVKAIDLTGPVKLVYTATPPSGAAAKSATGSTVTTKTVATANSLNYSGTQKMAYLTGDVKITHDDPSVFSQPAVLTGDKATVNMNPNIGPEDFRFRLESSPGVSRLEVTPKEGAAAPK